MLLKFPIVLSVLSIKIMRRLKLTMSAIANPFVHLIKMPDETDNCFTGKEKVNPRSLLLSSDISEPSPSFSTKSFNAEAIKSKRAYIAVKNKNNNNTRTHISAHENDTR